MEQTSIHIGDIEVPIIIDGGEEWFPVSFITTKILLRSDKGSLLNKQNKDKYSDQLYNYIIRYGDKNEQESRCISRIGLTEVLKKIRKGWLSSEQILSQNELHKYLGLELLPIEDNKKEELVNIFESYSKGKIKRLPESYENKESYEKMIKHLYEVGRINIKNLTIDFLRDSLGLKGVRKYLSIIDIYGMLFGEDFYLFAWKYPKFTFREIKLTYEIANIIVNNYIKENGIVIKNTFDFNYSSLFTNSGVYCLSNVDLLYFIVQLYDYRYAGYTFKTQAVNYYNNEKNLLFDLKYLIESDLKLNIEKIPLYLTKTKLREKANSMYHYIITKGNGSIYKWVDKLYSNKFTESDFDVNSFRDGFGSDIEYFIDEILRENFKNVIYNQIHTDRTIVINGMVPDWLIISDSGIWIVEYFGLYEERHYGKNSRVTDYINKTKRKIDRYREVSGHKFIFLYPNDIVDDFKGCREIIEKMKENPYVSML